MPSNARRKQPVVQNNFTHSESWEIRRVRIARVAEEASNLPGNDNGPDLEAFALKYRLGNSDFA